MEIIHIKGKCVTNMKLNIKGDLHVTALPWGLKMLVMINEL